MTPPLRLQVYLARAGVASRRKCEELITAGRVRVNGQVASTLGTKVDPRHDKVAVDGRRVVLEAPVYLLLHKPRGTVTTVNDPTGRPTVMKLVGDTDERLFPVGRLDFNTDGVLLLTNDGELAHALMHPRHGVRKTYHAKLRGDVPEAALDELRRGVVLDDGERTLPAEVVRLGATAEAGNTWLEITIREGKNRQVHRMADAIGYPVSKLSRVRYANLTVDDLVAGAFRSLTAAELGALRRLARGGVDDEAPARVAPLDARARPDAPPRPLGPRPAHAGRRPAHEAQRRGERPRARDTDRRGDVARAPHAAERPDRAPRGQDAQRRSPDGKPAARRGRPAPTGRGGAPPPRAGKRPRRPS